MDLPGVKHGYKVCTMDSDGRLWSAVAGFRAFRDLKPTEYHLNEWVERPYHCGPLGVHDVLDQTLQYKQRDERRRCFKCAYVPSASHERKFHQSVVHFGWTAAYDASMADCVMLLEEVPW